MKFFEMKLIFMLTIWLLISIVSTENKDQKSTSAVVQEVSQEQINNIPEAPVGTEQAPVNNIPQDTPEQTSKESNTQTDIPGPKIIDSAVLSENKEKIEPVATKTEEKSEVTEQPGSVTPQQLSTESVTDAPKSENENEKKDQILDSPINDTVQVHPEQPVGENLLKIDGEEHAALDSASKETSSVPEVETEAQEKKPAEEIETFTEWTQKVLEEEKQRTATETTGSSVSKSIRSTNYASKECGAKVLASNPDAENVKAVLTSNKDEYMINPCKVAKKWFVVELCEPVHVSHFEVASFELFSSQPKTFRISLSDRYPTKEWKSIGDFIATEARSSQSFDVEKGYVVQFVKVEMLDHYGTEHFCPLTWFRLYGIPVEYDDEYAHRPQEINDDQDMDEALLRSGDSTDTHKNLFASATDTVMKLVKKVLNVGSAELDKNKTATANDTKSVEISNDTLSINLTADGIILPCDPKKFPKEEKKAVEPIHPQPPNATTGFVTSITENSEVDVSIVTKLEDHEQVPSVNDNLVTFIENEEEGFASCDFTSNRLSPLSYYQKPLCAYLTLMHYSEKLSTCSLNESQNTENDMKEKSDSNEKQGEIIDQKTLGNVIMEPTISDSKTWTSVEEVKTKQEVQKSIQGESTTAVLSTDVKPSAQDPEMSTKSPSSVAMDKTSDTQATISPTTSSTQMDATKTSSSETDNIVIAPSGSGSTEDVSQSLQPSSQDIELKSSEATPSLSEAESSSEQSTVNFILLKTDSSTPSDKQTEQTSEIKQKPEVPVIEERTQIEPSSTAEVPQAPPRLQINASESEGPSTDVVEPVVTGDNIPEVQNSRGLGLVNVPVMPYQKRETAIMRLNNRIKVLEMNVSLSSRFLEEMSKKFKKQTEDMIKQHVFNVTIGELTNVTKAVEKQSLLQKQKLDVLETKVQNLTEVVLRLTEKLDNLNQQVQDKDFNYIVTIVVIVVIVLILIKWRTARVSPEKQSPVNSPKVSPGRRRNSFSGCEHDKVENLGSNLQRFNSDSTLVTSKRYSSDPGGTSIHQVKKRKKKKQKIHDTSTLASSEREVIPNKTGLHSAGLIFEFSSRESSPERRKDEKKINKAHHNGGIWSFFGSDKQEHLKPKGPDKMEHAGNGSKVNGHIPKKSTKQGIGRICNPAKTSNSAMKTRRSGSFNGVENGHDSNDHDSTMNGTNSDQIVIVSPFKKGLSFSKGASLTNHRESVLKGQNGRQGHKRASSTDMTQKNGSINGYK